MKPLSATVTESGKHPPVLWNHPLRCRIFHCSLQKGYLPPFSHRMLILSSPSVEPGPFPSLQDTSWGFLQTMPLRCYSGLVTTSSLSQFKSCGGSQHSLPCMWDCTKLQLRCWKLPISFNCPCWLSLHFRRQRGAGQQTGEKFTNCSGNCVPLPFFISSMGLSCLSEALQFKKPQTFQVEQSLFKIRTMPDIIRSQGL